MVRSFGSRNRVYRVAKRDAKRIAATEQCAMIGRAFADGFTPDADGKIAGYAPAHARKVLRRAMGEVAEMAHDERERLKLLPPPAAGGTAQRRALELRATGMPYEDIAAMLGVPASTAHDWVTRQLERTLGEEVRQVDAARHLELARLDGIFGPQYAKALGGDVRAAETCLKIMERRAKLLGLDAPVKVDVEHRLRELAREHGLDEDWVVEEGRAVLKALSRRGGA